MKYFAVSLFALLLTFQTFGQKATVEGSVLAGSATTVYLQKFVNAKPVVLDSTVLGKNNKFELETAISQGNFYRLSTENPNNFILLWLNPNEKLTVHSQSKKIAEKYTVKGSPDSEAIAKFSNTEAKFQARSIALRKAPKETTHESVVQGPKPTAQDQLQREYRQFVLDFAKDNAKSPAALMALGKLKIRQDFTLFKTVRDGLTETHPNSEYAKQLQGMVAQREKELATEGKTAVGAKAIDIALPTPEGETVALSSFKGKYVLIDFWASWCGPCRRENPNVVKLYQKYNKAGFEVFSVSLDNNKDKWVNAIKQDGLEWTHVSDLLGWKCAPAKKYGVRGIPFTVLVDKEGTIIANKLRGPQLEAKLQELFGF